MRAGRPKVALRLTDTMNDGANWTRSRTGRYRHWRSRRAGIILACADGTDTSVPRGLNVHLSMDNYSADKIVAIPDCSRKGRAFTSISQMYATPSPWSGRNLPTRSSPAEGADPLPAR